MLIGQLFLRSNYWSIINLYHNQKTLWNFLFSLTTLKVNICVSYQIQIHIVSFIQDLISISCCNGKYRPESWSMKHSTQIRPVKIIETSIHSSYLELHSTYCSTLKRKTYYPGYPFQITHRWQPQGLDSGITTLPDSSIPFQILPSIFLAQSTNKISHNYLSHPKTWWPLSNLTITYMRMESGMTLEKPI